MCVCVCVRICMGVVEVEWGEKERSDTCHTMPTDCTVTVCVCRKTRKDEELKRKAKMEKKVKVVEETTQEALQRQKEEEAQKRYEDWMRNKVVYHCSFCTVVLWGLCVQGIYIQ